MGNIVSTLKIPAPEPGQVFRPLHDLVLLERLRERKKGRFFVPDQAREKLERTTNTGVIARVLAVGAGRLLEDGGRVEPAVKVGDVVVVPALVGRGATNWGDEERWFLKAEGILAIVDELEPEWEAVG